MLPADERCKVEKRSPIPQSMLLGIMKRVHHQSVPTKSVSPEYNAPKSKKKYHPSAYKKDNGPKTESDILAETRRRKNIKLYNRYINEAAKRKNLGFAKTLLEQLKGQSLTPNEFTYTSMINACSRVANVEDAEVYLREMQDAELAPNEITWTAIIKGATGVFDLDKAESLLEEMTSSGVAPNVRTFNTILRACTRTGDFERTQRLWKQLEAANVAPDTSSLSALTRIQAQALKLKEAKESLGRLEALVKERNAKQGFYIVDPTIYLLLASLNLLTGSPFDRVASFMTKFDKAIKLVETQKKKQGGKGEDEEGAATVELLDPEMLLEGKYIRSVLESEKPLPKEVTSKAKLGPVDSGIVKVFTAGGSDNFKWTQSKEAKAHTVKRKLELCSGSGDWVISRAQADEKVEWAAVEIRFDRIHEIWRKVLLNRLENRITVIHADASKLSEIVPPGSVDEIFINFPDPAPSRTDPNRLISAKLLAEMAKILVPGGMVVVASDDFDYVRWIKEDASDMPTVFDASRMTTAANNDAYGTSFFDHLWTARGRTERSWLTLYTLPASSNKKKKA